MTAAIFILPVIGVLQSILEVTWESEFPSISERLDIMGTLYNIGHDISDPHFSPRANPFGKYVGGI